MSAGSMETLKLSICRMLEEKKLADDSLIIVLAGSFGPAHGASFIEIATAGALKEKCVIA
jgi:pyruvate kinase